MNTPTTKFLARPDAVNVAHTAERCAVLGPGRRFVVWVQGCPKRCPGCHNPQFLPFEDACWLTVDALAKRILSVDNTEGVTFVGGEPFAQAAALAAVGRAVRRAGLSVVVYSGFTMAELASGRVPDARLLLDAADLLLDGPYRKDLPTQKPWRGSDNQQLIALSDRYTREHVAAWNQPIGQSFELRVAPDGTLEVLGIPPVSLVARDMGAGLPFHAHGKGR